MRFVVVPGPTTPGLSWIDYPANRPREGEGSSLSEREAALLRLSMEMLPAVPAEVRGHAEHPARGTSKRGELRDPRRKSLTPRRPRAVGGWEFCHICGNDRARPAVKRHVNAVRSDGRIPLLPEPGTV